MRYLLIVLALLSTTAFAQVGGSPPRNPALQWIYGELKQRAAVWGGFDQDLAKIKRPKPYAGLWFAECGAANAFFDRNTKKIIVCYELAHDAAKQTGAGGQGAAGYVLFVIMHEYGHALIAAADTPPLGREEDAADQIAAVLMRKSGNVAGIIHDLMKTDWRPRWNENLPTRGEMADEHSMTPQRRANVICWAAADDRALMESAIRAGIMTPQRANRCAHEAEQAERAVTALLRG